MADPCFLSVEDIRHIHRREIEQAGGDPGIRDHGLVESSTYAAQASFEGEWLHSDLFEMAGAYLVAFVQNHPFVDGNKRTGTAAALTFLYMNGYELTEDHPQELADIVLDFVTHAIDRDSLVNYLRLHSEHR